MAREEGVGVLTVGAKSLWSGHVIVAAGVKSTPHHHGDTESAIRALRRRALAVRADLSDRADIDNLRTEMRSEIGSLRSEVGSLRTEFDGKLARLEGRMYAANAALAIAVAGLVIAAAKVL